VALRAWSGEHLSFFPLRLAPRERRVRWATRASVRHLACFAGSSGDAAHNGIRSQDGSSLSFRRLPLVGRQRDDRSVVRISDSESACRRARSPGGCHRYRGSTLISSPEVTLRRGDPCSHGGCRRDEVSIGAVGSLRCRTAVRRRNTATRIHPIRDRTRSAMTDDHDTDTADRLNSRDRSSDDTSSVNVANCGSRFTHTRVVHRDAEREHLSGCAAHCWLELAVLSEIG
jgi:hypothetical protein